MVIFGTVFSVMQFRFGYNDSETLQVMQTSGPASTGLTFVWMPQLFATMNFGRIMAILFFLGLSFAGFSSLISMLELATRNLVDRGIGRKKAVMFVVSFVYLLGVPSAISLQVLSNQDFVWGLGLMVSGVFIAFFALRLGMDELKENIKLAAFDWPLGKWWDLLTGYFIPFAGVCLLIWWMSLTITVFAPDDWYNPLNPFSLMTVWVQWLLVIFIFVVFNKKISKPYN
jgi:neurotransmitter:Na+ symporter, NSS family